MKTYSGAALPKIEALGPIVRIHLNELVETKDQTGTPFTQFIYDTITADVKSNRAELIQAIIADKYSVADEIALLHNQTTKPIEYVAYQDYRVLAKVLAAEVLVVLSTII